MSTINETEEQAAGRLLIIGLQELSLAMQAPEFVQVIGTPAAIQNVKQAHAYVEKAYDLLVTLWGKP